MTYAEQMASVLLNGITNGSIVNIGPLQDAPGWLRQNMHTICPTCDGTGKAMLALNNAAPGEVLHLMSIVCPRCFGRGDVPYICMN